MGQPRPHELMPSVSQHRIDRRHVVFNSILLVSVSVIYLQQPMSEVCCKYFSRTESDNSSPIRRIFGVRIVGTAGVVDRLVVAVLHNANYYQP